MDLADGGRRAAPPHDPFTRIASARVLCVEAGALGSVALPAGPTIERHGSANPWPWPTF